MSTTIKFFDPSRLRQEEARTFHEMMTGLFAKITHELVQPAKADYGKKFTAFKDALKPDAKSQITAEINALDVSRGQLFVSSRALLRALTGHFDPEKAAIAQAAYDLYRKYGEVNTLPYLEESGCLDDLVDDLTVLDNAAPGETPSAEHNRLAFIAMKEWVDEITRVKDLFKVAFLKRLEEQSVNVVGLTATTRKALDSSYLEAVRKANAVIELFGDEGMEDPVAQMNDLIDYQAAILKARHGTGGVKEDPTTPDSPDGGTEGDTEDGGDTTPDNGGSDSGTGTDGGSTPGTGGDTNPDTGGGDDGDDNGGSLVG